jgi:hypothetical protein
MRSTVILVLVLAIGLLAPAEAARRRSSGAGGMSPIDPVTGHTISHRRPATSSRPARGGGGSGFPMGGTVVAAASLALVIAVGLGGQGGHDDRPADHAHHARVHHGAGDHDRAAGHHHRDR